MQKHDVDATEQLMPDDYAYEHFDLKYKEFTYAVDDSNLDRRLTVLCNSYSGSGWCQEEYLVNSARNFSDLTQTSSSISRSQSL